ncbi:MAG: hypothetical protein SGJ13_14465, partial [Actinomycetota bacterium]|nr:hypothetical protein [Actinomycetota bacterium]
AGLHKTAGEKRAGGDIDHGAVGGAGRLIDEGAFSADTKKLKAVEPSLDWGSRLQVRVAPDGHVVEIPELGVAVSVLASLGHLGVGGAVRPRSVATPFSSGR